MTKANEVIQKLLKARAILSTAESCTGGLIATRITDIAGASEVFFGGVIAYDNRAKQKILEVPPLILDKYGAVSAETAQCMADGGLRIMEQTLGRGDRPLICIATTGIAGPGGGTRTKPVGLCYLGLAISGRPTLSVEIRAPEAADRAANREYFADRALQLILDSIG